MNAHAHPHPTPAPLGAAALSRQDKARITTIQRGATLFADGYRIEPYADRPGIYAVYQPEGRRIPKGCAAWYDVDIANQDCQCAAFEQLGTCKHLIATNKAVAEAARLMAPLIPVTPPAAAAAPVPAPAPRVVGFGSREEFLRQRRKDFG